MYIIKVHSSYTNLAALIITQLTICNGWRGEEVAMMTIKEYEVANTKSNAEFILVNLKGKGKRFVTVSKSSNNNPHDLFKIEY